MLAILCSILPFLVIPALGCTPAPRDASLPRYAVVVNFSHNPPLRSPSVIGYGSFSGATARAPGSSARHSLQVVDGQNVLALDYELGGSSVATVYAGLYVNVIPTTLYKDWNTFAFELRAAPETGRVDAVGVEAKLSRYGMKRYCSASALHWTLCISSFSSLDAGVPDSSRHYKQLAVVFNKAKTEPNKGRLLVRRIYLLASQADLPPEIDRSLVVNSYWK